MSEKGGSEMASGEESIPGSSPQENGSNTKVTLTEVDEMRIEIRKLQEKKAEAMMGKVVQLQKERDILVGRNKVLSQTIQDLSLELEKLKEDKRKAASKASQLESNIFEEKMHSNELKRKLQMANKQVAHLKSEIKNMKSRLGDSGSLLQVSLDMESSLERSRSLNDIGQEVDKEETNKEQEEQDTPPPQYPLQNLKRDLSVGAPKETPSPLVQSQRASEVLTPSKSLTPTSTLAPKRYILATEKPKNVGTQTETMPEENMMKIAEVEAMQAKNEEEKKSLKKTIGALQLEAKRERECKLSMEKRVKEIQVEHDVLKTGLDAFNTWTRQKLQSIEEDIDVCRVVYSLHGSMSQEAQLIQGLQEKLSVSEQKHRDAEALNKYLNSNIETLEERVRHYKKRNDLLKEKVILLTPVKSSKQSFYPTETSSPKLQVPGTPPTLRAPVNQLSRQHFALTPQMMRSPMADPSPLVHNNKTTPTIKLSPDKSKTDDQFKRRAQSHVEGAGRKGRQDRGGGMKDKRRLSGDKESVVKEKLVKNGDSWFSIPDDDDDDDSVV